MNDYIKQLEEENESLKKRLEVADLKAECYDIIMSNVVHKESVNNKGFTTHSDVYVDSGTRHIKGLTLRVEIILAKTSRAALTILNDYIEDDKMLQGHNKK
jgi:hypothetical protein